ncbi:MAG: hypothetical protein AC479_06915 [miscellaneous Crenarchaeota group-6 archaeon AD8-1]|nr:MAG: hypothetical protein AC479_06915 [miscellaneous Crenarchaeota group-6 archaeon AD8-1]
MPKKTLLITALLLLLLVESAIALPKTKDPKPKPPKIPKNPKIETITFTEIAKLGAGNIYLGNQEIINTGTIFVQDAISTGIVSTGDSPISGFEIQTILSGTLDLNTYHGTYNGEWTLTDPTGAFEGTINGKVALKTRKSKAHLSAQLITSK